jgi:hypothetical protein
MAWEALISIYEEAAQYMKDEKIQPPQACPFDGEPLVSTPDGKGLFCRFDGYLYPEMPRLI